MKVAIRSAFHQQCCVEDGQRRAAQPCALGDPAIRFGAYVRVHDLVQRLPLGGVGEDPAPQSCSVDTAPFIEYLATEARHERLMGGAFRGYRAMGQLVGIQDEGTELGQHLGHGALARGDPAGQAHPEHRTGTAHFTPLTGGSSWPLPECS